MAPGQRWDYQGNAGPSYWANSYVDCGLNKQSPINIELAEVIVDTDLPDFNISSFNNIEGVEQHLENVFGHTAEVKYGGTNLTISGGNLHGTYMVDQFHFHWGKVDGRGSEHKINNKSYDMEMHIVHHSTLYSNISEAMNKPYGLAVIGFFVQVSAEDNEKFSGLLSHFENITHAGDSTPIHEPIVLSEIIPEDLEVYYRYDGSLTTPPCYQSVVWTIFQKPIYMSEKQLNIFRGLKRNADGETERELVDDFRPIQGLNNRAVKTNHERGRPNETSNNTISN
ncbi:hypothetical protein LOTGIDRAFT_239347, partial [Lottia gigantea]